MWGGGDGGHGRDVGIQMGMGSADMDGVREFGWGMWVWHILKWEGVWFRMGCYYTLYQLWCQASKT